MRFPLSLSFLHLNYKERVNLNEESQRTKRKEEKAKWNEKKVSVTHASFPFTLPFSPSFPLSFRSFTLSLHFIVMSGEERERGKEQVRKRNEVIREKRASLLFLTFSRVSLQFSSHSRSIPFNFKWTKRARELNGTGTEWTNLIYLWLAVVHFSFIITACLRSTSLPVILKWKGTTMVW